MYFTVFLKCLHQTGTSRNISATCNIKWDHQLDNSCEKMCKRMLVLSISCSEETSKRKQTFIHLLLPQNSCVSSSTHLTSAEPSIEICKLGSKASQSWSTYISSNEDTDEVIELAVCAIGGGLHWSPVHCSVNQNRIPAMLRNLSLWTMLFSPTQIFLIRDKVSDLETPRVASSLSLVWIKGLLKRCWSWIFQYYSD